MPGFHTKISKVKVSWFQNLAMTKPDTPVNPRNRIRGLLGNLAKDLKAWEGAIDMALSVKTDYSISQMREYKKKCENYLDKVKDLTMDLNDLEPDKMEENDSTVDKWQTNFDKVHNKFFEAEKTLSRPVPVRSAATA